MHFDRRLIVGRRREGLRLLGRNRRVARNHWRGHATERFDGQRQRSDVQQQQIFHFALEHATLNRRTNGHNFVGINSLVRLFAEQLLNQRLDARHTGLPAD